MANVAGDSAETGEDWAAANQRHLTAALAAVAHRLGAAIRPGHTEPERNDDLPGAELPRSGAHAPFALDVLGAAFGLSSFEREVLVLSAGVDLDGSFAALCAEVNGDPARPYPTFGLALAMLPDAHWSALSPGAPLRQWQLVDIGGGTVTSGALRIDERILHYLAGVNHLDTRVAGHVEPVSQGDALAPSHRRVAAMAAGLCSGSAGRQPVIQLCGADRAAKPRVAAAACADLGLTLHRINAHAVPTGADLDWFCRLGDREAVLLQSALLVSCDERADADGDAAIAAAAARLAGRLRVPVVVATREPLADLDRASVRLDVARPTRGEQRDRWLQLLPRHDADADTSADTHEVDRIVDRIVSHFDLGFGAIEAAADYAQATIATQDGNGRPNPWDACRVQSRARLDDFAQRVEPSEHQTDLVLPDAQMRLLDELAAHVRHRSQVYGEWGFADTSTRGLGITALFTGPSGAGKTLAAEVTARALELDLYRIDLSTLVSKYIGETEKNLRRVFDAAEEGGAVLLFDEADALFGKRTEVKDSHDRYANMEVSYLLQRMETYRGLAILTTNLKNGLDTAFQRRIRFVIQFPFPDVAARTEIWRDVFPTSTPLGDVDLAWLASLDVSGGSIRNIAIGAAFLAAAAGTPIGMSHLEAAARTECAKLDKPLPTLVSGRTTAR